MSHVTISYEQSLMQGKPMSEIPEGTVFTGSVDGCDSHLFLAAYECVISLDNPHNTWSIALGFVEEYQPVDLEIKVKPQRKNA